MTRPRDASFIATASPSTDNRPGDREVELWRVDKDSRELRCLAVYMPTGTDLQLMESEDFRRTQLRRDGPAVEALAEEWHAKLQAAGWA